MEKFKKIIVLNNEVEAGLMEEILKESQIPHIIQSYHSMVYNGIFQLNRGWGYIEADEKYESHVVSIYNDLKNIITE